MSSLVWALLAFLLFEILCFLALTWLIEYHSTDEDPERDCLNL